ncbi:MAG: glycosyl transferase group 1 [Candidatus Acidoferrum typicum]|nr:glycosyl transferase group 1 [Candidatus Acidoferrum typicum]
MKVLLVDLETEWRGGQNQALLLLKGLRDRGHEAELVTAHSSALGERARTAGTPVHLTSRGFFRVAAAQKVRNVLRNGKFDLVHANEAHAVTAVWLALWQRREASRVPFVISRRVGYPIGKASLAQARYRTAARIVANSKWVAEQAAASGAPREKLSVVYEGAEIPPRFTAEQRQHARARWGISQSTKLLGCVGVLLPDKGQEWLIRALAEMKREFPGTKLLLAGDGPCRAQLEALGRELGLADDVIFAGFVRDVENVYAALDVFLLPSFFEALNNSLLAAMAYEIPSIAFNKGALGEIIENGKSGLLVSGPDAAEISDAALKILRDHNFAMSLGRTGRARIEEKFSAEKMVTGMIQVYEESLRGKAV